MYCSNLNQNSQPGGGGVRTHTRVSEKNLRGHKMIHRMEERRKINISATLNKNVLTDRKFTDAHFS